MNHQECLDDSPGSDRTAFGPRALHAPPLLTDRSLVLNAQSGNRGAFNLLVLKYRRRIFNLGFRYMRNRADADDVVQETFVKALGGLKNFRGECAFYSWLHRIAINTAKTAIQLRAKEAHCLSFETLAMDDSAESKQGGVDLDTPEDIALTGEICGVVNDALESLSQELREAIMLREFNGNTYQEVALAMACPVGTVRSRVYRAREAIDLKVRKVFDDGLGRRRGMQPADASKCRSIVAAA